MSTIIFNSKKEAQDWAIVRKKKFGLTSKIFYDGQFWCVSTDENKDIDLITKFKIKGLSDEHPAQKEFNKFMQKEVSANSSHS